MYLAWIAWRFWLDTQSDKDDLSGGWRYLPFKKLGPECRQLVAIRETTAKLLALHCTFDKNTKENSSLFHHQNISYCIQKTYSGTCNKKPTLLIKNES